MEAEVRLTTPPKNFQQLEERAADLVSNKSCTHILFKQLVDGVTVAFIKGDLDQSENENGTIGGLPKSKNDEILISVMLADENCSEFLTCCKGVRI